MARRDRQYNGPRRRRQVGETKPVQSRLPLVVYDRAMLAAARLDISLSAYLELLIRQDPVDTTGRPLWDPPPPLGVAPESIPGLDELTA